MAFTKFLCLGCTFTLIVGLIGCSAQNDAPIKNQSLNSEVPSMTNEFKLEHEFTGFSSPTAIAFDSANNMYISNWGNGTVSKINVDGLTSIFISDLGAPAGLAVDSEDNLYIADYSGDVIYKCSPSGQIETFAQGLHTPTGISLNSAGELLVANRSNNEIIKIDKEGNIITLSKQMDIPVGVIEMDDILYTTNYGGCILTITPDNDTNTLSTEFGRPGVGIDVDHNGTIYAADNGNDCVRIINSDGSTKVIIKDIGGCVGLKIHSDTLYVSSWNEGSVYAYSFPTK